MKTRTGFVSNSSSSSFIVGFVKRPKTVKEMKTLLFGDGDYVTYYDYSISAQAAAERVFNDLKSQKRPISVKKAIEEVNSGYFDGYPSYSYKNRPSDAVRKEFSEKFPKADMYGDKAPKDPEAVALIKKYDELNRAEWDEGERKRLEAAKNYTETKVLPKMKGKKMFVFSYADDGGECVLEHGDIFANLPHVRISHH